MTAHRSFAHRRRLPALRTRPAQRSRGAAAVETAFALPVFLLLFVGVADLGMGAVQHSQATSAAADATRVGVVLADPPDTASCATDSGYQKVIAAAQERIPGRHLGCENVEITCFTPVGDVINCASADTLNDRMRVSVHWTWEAFSPIGQAAPIDEVIGATTMRFVPQPKAPGVALTPTTFPAP